MLRTNKYIWTSRHNDVLIIDINIDGLFQWQIVIFNIIVMLEFHFQRSCLEHLFT